MKRNLLMLLVAFLIAGSAIAQKPTISFKVKEHDFGQVNEEDGKVSYVFEFTNTGSETLVIQNVQASCGCTTPDWPKEPFAPGKSGKITATYNPQGRPGSFTKTITVTSNASNASEILIIKGTVISKAQTSNLQYQMGGLKYASKIVQMNNVFKGKAQTRSIAIKNTTNSDMKVEVANLPIYVTAVVTPSTLKPGEDGKIDFMFNSSKVSQWGSLNNDLYLVLNGKKALTDEYKLGLFANVVEDFSTGDKKSAPILEIKSSNIYLGEITRGRIIRGKVNIKNSGVNPLEIRRIANNNPEVTIHPLTNIKGGKASELKIDINAKSLTAGSYSKVFTMQTNDPQNQFVVFNLSWKVK